MRGLLKISPRSSGARHSRSRVPFVGNIALRWSASIGFIALSINISLRWSETNFHCCTWKLNLRCDSISRVYRLPIYLSLFSGEFLGQRDDDARTATLA